MQRIDPLLRIQDPVLLELNVLAELEEVFVRKWTPRFAATLEAGSLRTDVEALTEQSRELHADLQEAISNWIATEGEKVLLGEQAMDVSRHEFLRNLLLFKATSAAVLERAAENAPSPAIADRLRMCAKRSLAHVEQLEALLGPDGL